MLLLPCWQRNRAQGTISMPSLPSTPCPSPPPIRADMRADPKPAYYYYFQPIYASMTGASAGDRATRPPLSATANEVQTNARKRRAGTLLRKKGPDCGRRFGQAKPLLLGTASGQSLSHTHTLTHKQTRSSAHSLTLGAPILEVRKRKFHLTLGGSGCRRSRHPL